MAAAAGYSLDWIAFNRGSKKVGSAPGTFPALNEEVLVEVIAVLEAVIQERHVAMTPEKKAQLTVLLYEELAGQGAAEAVPNMERILRLVKLAAG